MVLRIQKEEEYWTYKLVGDRHKVSFNEWLYFRFWSDLLVDQQVKILNNTWQVLICIFEYVWSILTHFFESMLILLISNLFINHSLTDSHLLFLEGPSPLKIHRVLFFLSLFKTYFKMPFIDKYVKICQSSKLSLKLTWKHHPLYDWANLINN